jgi:hypothetical protein
MKVDCARESQDKVGAAAISIALLVSMFATAALAYVDTSSFIQLTRSRQYATDVPQSGVLLGHNALDHLEWVPAKEGKVALFSVAAPGKLGDIEFWRDIALRTRTAAPDVRFVGVCATHESCGLSEGSEGALTLLTSMDPVQMRAVAMAARRGGALLYLGATLYGQPTIKGDRQAFADDIASTFNRPARPPTDAAFKAATNTGGA